VGEETRARLSDQFGASRVKGLRVRDAPPKWNVCSLRETKDYDTCTSCHGLGQAGASIVEHQEIQETERTQCLPKKANRTQHLKPSLALSPTVPPLCAATKQTRLRGMGSRDNRMVGNVNKE
jgi:hypothetical protein